MTDRIIELCKQIAETDFDTVSFYFEQNGSYGLLSTLNKWNTCLLKIELEDLNDKTEQIGVLKMDDLMEGNSQFQKVDNPNEISTTILDKFEQELFDDKGYYAYDYQMFLRKINCKYNERGEVMISVDGKEGIYSQYFLKSTILLNDDKEDLVYLKLSYHDTPLYLKYNLDKATVYAIIAPKITAHDACNIVKVMGI